MLLAQSQLQVNSFPSADTTVSPDGSSLTLPMFLILCILAVFAREYYREWKMSRRYRRWAERWTSVQ